MLDSIYVRLAGGLGNQLFMYAFGLSKARSMGKSLVLDDLSGFSHRDVYNAEFSLGLFLLDEKLLSELKLKRKFANRYFWFLAKVFGISHVENNPYEYDCRASNSSALFYQGYWQSHLYFDNYKEVIKTNLRLKDPDDVRILGYKKQIQRAKNAVFVGVRMYPASVQEEYGAFDEAYIRRAFDMIESSQVDATYFVFSVDISTARELFSGFSDKEITFVEPIGGLRDAALDLYLMSLCRHFILADSTMYWWAAYLGESDESMVLTPGKMLNQELPPSWIRVV